MIQRVCIGGRKILNAISDAVDFRFAFFDATIGGRAAK